ncbi:Cytochrome P450 monooxygenase [Rasamsonia emersonii CBS 393.64]|uniref:Cytochrome P450 monooxygenase n=1 Tax=Rasamsonia emersonii (strain ATCC 16479 / CBS 393.64 / IMI 116815) TaxID=1408163 RepID=A0A0F4Z0E3_RASE3|nr:Cytochrome P450 monooxygenase [Rasamsonia emersonii CBS 393.64]KKA23820.1 Cytochrome P450 monooxygenase [Rasamsonia emersonii CBS 393.64]
MLLFSEELQVNAALTLLETFVLLWTAAFPQYSFTQLFLRAFGVNLAIQIFWDMVIYPHLVNPLRHLPRVKSISSSTPPRPNPLEWIRTIPNDGLIHFRDTFNRSYLLATSHQALLDIMSTNTYDFEKPWRVREFLARIIGFGLILSEGTAHRVQRKALTPAFHIKNIRSLYTLMWDKTTILLDQLEKEIKLNPVDGMNAASASGKVEMSVWASRLTLDVIGPAAMGRDFQSLTHAENKVADSFLAILEPTKEKLIFLGINFLLPQWFARRIPWRLNKHETTASALTWACYLLCLHPDIQTRLRQEIHTVIPSANHPITWNDLESMPLLNGVCQEVLRLYPTVPATIREAVRDSYVAGKKIPRGTRIILCPYAINRSPDFWGETGEEFRPERWIDTDEKGHQVVNHHGGAPTNFAQITFLHGQRSCIGKDFARAELRCAVAGVVGRFAMELQDPNQKVHISGAVTTKPREGMHLKLTKVEGCIAMLS